MSAAADPLLGLFLALFSSETELRRFLTLSGFERVEYRQRQRKGGSLRAAAADASAALQDADLVQRPLFDALVRRAPDRAADIWEVARSFGIEMGPPGPPPVAAPPPPPAEAAPPFQEFAPADAEPSAPPEADAVPERYAKYVADLEAELAASAPLQPEEEALSAERWPWTAAAAVLGSFHPLELRPLHEDTESAYTALADAVFTTAEGRWALDELVRAEALLRLRDEAALEKAIEANAPLSDSHRDWMRRLVTLEAPPSLASLDTRELGVLDTVTRWLEPLDLQLPITRAEIYAAVERRSLIDPLRKLVGTHFRGRVEELERIERHIRGEGDASTIVISGVGGSGKSSLLGKVLVGLEDRIAEVPVSFAYVDFDKARHNPRDARGLVEQIARQLRLLYAANAEAGRDFSGVESLSAGTDVELAAEVLELDTEFEQLDVDSLIRELSIRLDDLARAYPTPLVIILDTFEEVQIQGPGAVADVFALIDKFRAELPRMRLIVSGRGDLGNVVDNDPEAMVQLGDLDAASADAVLESLGVDAPDVRKLIYERFRGNPLVLHLAAEALRRMETAEKAFEGVLGQADVVAAVGIEQIQGMLYDRILGHIGDPEVVKVAHPGLAVRRVDVDVIREVLAGPCELDPSRAEAIFERLQREVSMFQLEPDGALRHRQDVRRLMLRTMLDEPRVKKVVARIHPLAVAFYERRGGTDARAEEIYHRLMSGQDPRTMQSLWGPELRESLFPALEDPLSEAARTWLRRRLGLIAAEDERAAWDQEDWEAEAADRARSWLASASPRRALNVLAEREARLPGSRLYPLEVQALIQQKRLDEAAKLLDHGMRESVEAGAVVTQRELAEQAIALATIRKDAAGIVSATESAVRLGDLAGDPLGCLDELAGSVDALKQIGAPDEAGRLADRVSRRFSQLSADVLREHPDLVRKVMQSVGATDSSVLTQAAESVGDITSEDEAVFRDDVFALSRLLESTVPAARTAMNRLAVEVGLSEDKWTPHELAASAVEFGRTGQAVVVGLDYAAEEAVSRRLIVEDLTRPAVS
jgi:hypothetical protein